MFWIFRNFQDSWILRVGSKASERSERSKAGGTLKSGIFAFFANSGNVWVFRKLLKRECIVSWRVFFTFFIFFTFFHFVIFFHFFHLVGRAVFLRLNFKQRFPARSAGKRERGGHINILYIGHSHDFPKKVYVDQLNEKSEKKITK